MILKTDRRIEDDIIKDVTNSFRPLHQKKRNGLLISLVKH